MTDMKLTDKTLSCILKVLVITSVLLVLTQAEASEDMLISSCPQLDKAAKAFFEGKLDVATQVFETFLQETFTPSFARGLALFGLAEAALARQDFNAAIAAWKRPADDEKLLRFHRDIALRRISETERLKKGLPARDPASYRTRLPVLPVPGKVIYVAPTGSDTVEGSQTKHFRTLERARDAVRSLKQLNSGKLPKGGVKIMIGGWEYPLEKTLRIEDLEL